MTRTTRGDTCFNSVGSPSKIDYTVFSRSLIKNFVAISACHSVPFKPHVAIRAEFALDLRVVRVHKLLVPKKLPVTAADPFTDAEWEEATAIAEKHVKVSRFFRLDMSTCIATASAMGSGVQSVEAGILLWQCGRTLETATLLRAGHDPNSRLSRPYFGRGAPPTFAYKQAAASHKPPCSAFPTPVGSSRGLSVAEAVLRSSRKACKVARKGGPNQHQVCLRVFPADFGVRGPYCEGVGRPPL